MLRRLPRFQSVIGWLVAQAVVVYAFGLRIIDGWLRWTPRRVNNKPPKPAQSDVPGSIFALRGAQPDSAQPTPTRLVSRRPGDPALFPDLTPYVVLQLWCGLTSTRDEWITAAASYGYRVELIEGSGGWLVTVYDDGRPMVPTVAAKPSLIGPRRQTLTA